MKKEQDKIAEKAYYKYLDKGSKNGGDVNDWLEAEKEVKKEKTSASKTAKTTKKVATTKKPAKVKKTAATAKKTTAKAKKK